MAEVIWGDDVPARVALLEKAAPGAADLIIEVASLLGVHPLIGRRVQGDVREVLISRGETGCIALYRFVPALDVLLVLAVRQQREGGYVEV